MTQLEKSHLQAIKGLPPALAIILWADQQALHLEDHRMFWGYIGQYLDYLQQKTHGLRPENPAKREPHPILQQKIEVYGDYYWAQFRLINAGWDKWIAPHSYHPDPRSLFTELLTMLARQYFEPCLQPISEGIPRKRLVQLQRDFSGFYRGRWESKEEAEIVAWLANSKDYFWMALIWDDRNRRELAPYWSDFQKSHKQLQRFIERHGSGIPSWHDGLPVGSKGERYLYKT